MRAYERMLRYTAVHTASDPDSDNTPSTDIQFDLARLLKAEMEELGISNIRVDKHCYVYGEIPASAGCEGAHSLGFIAHMDTAPDFSGENVRPQIIENYDGGDVTLGDSGRVLRVADFPHLPSLKGSTLITTDGTTLLGADDKAGIASILTAAERIITQDIPHGRLCIGFTPDEEIGRGAHKFDVEGFGADFAYTVDGGETGCIVGENFNACEAVFEVNGFNVHPGAAKNTMINAALVAMEINSMLPAGETPRSTEGYEGFYHLTSMQGNIETARLQYIVRDHSAEVFDARKRTLKLIEKLINEKYGTGTVKLTLRDQYRNMAEKIRPCYHLIENALEVCASLGLEAKAHPARGGTDGATLSFMGLPCPDLPTGGYAPHGPYEHITAEALDLSAEIVTEIIKRYSKPL